MDDIAICTITPKTPYTFTFEDIFDSSEEYIKKEIAENPTLDLNHRVWEYIRANWDIDDLINIVDEYIQFVPINEGLNIPGMPERFY